MTNYLDRTSKTGRTAGNYQTEGFLLGGWEAARRADKIAQEQTRCKTFTASMRVRLVFEIQAGDGNRFLLGLL
ncbi:MAG: hypothetical protein ACK53L_00675, partial [Pirellulaceae bacterium]